MCKPRLTSVASSTAIEVRSDLRLHGHPFQLSQYDTDLHKKSFVVRSLYEYTV